MVHRSAFAEILPRLELPTLSRSILLAFRNKDINAERLGKIVEANPSYREALLRRWLSLSRGTDAGARTDFLLVQLGMESARNFLVSMQAMRTLQGHSDFWSKEGKLIHDPSGVLRHALRAEEQAALVHGENPAIAYAGGLLFDLLALLPSTPELRGYSEAMYEQGLRAAQIASALGRRLPKSGLSRYLFGAAIVASAGKVLLAHSAPEFIPFDGRCRDRALPRVVAEFAVRKKFGVSPAQLAAQAGMAMGVFKKAERALLFCEQPFLLRSDPPSVYLLSAVLRLASNVASQPKRIERDDDPELARWKGLELRELPISEAELAQVVRAFSRSS